jgi:predicted DCC family thiol-disulfide oxidoreductase YuxK
MRDNNQNGWTGGQYSIFRACLGAYLLVHFAYLLPWAAELFSSAGMLPNAQLSPLTRAFPNILAIYDQPIFVIGLCASGAICALFLMAGKHDRIAALWIWYVLACFFGRNPLIQNPSLPYTGWMLLMHAAVTSAPYGSLDARGRLNPGNAWTLPQSLYASAWIVLALSYSYSGYTKLLSPSWLSGDTVAAVLNNPLARDGLLHDVALSLPPALLRAVTWFILAIEVLFAPLALSKRARPWIWSGMLLVQFGFAALLRFPDLTVAMLVFHLLTFDPHWVKPRSLDGVVVFYDGTCALCHGVVRFLLSEDKSTALRFAPLDGETSARLLPDRAQLPVSMIVRTNDGQTLTEDAAVLYLLSHLGGLWRVVAVLSQPLPRRARRYLYRYIGDRRHVLFGKASTACPLLPDNLRSRLLA